MTLGQLIAHNEFLFTTPWLTWFAHRGAATSISQQGRVEAARSHRGWG